MRANWNSRLEQLVRRVDSPARIYPYLTVEGATDLRQRYDQWNGPTYTIDTESGTATSGSTTNLQDTTKTWPTNRWARDGAGISVVYNVTVTISGVPYTTQIASSSTNNLLFVTPLPVAVTAGSTYVITSNVEFTPDGGVRIKATSSPSAADITQTSWIQAVGDSGTGMPGSAGSFLVPLTGVKNGIVTAPIFGGLVQWGANRSPAAALTQILAYLNPQGNVGLIKNVANWCCDIYHIIENRTLLPGHPQPLIQGSAWVLTKLAHLVTPASGQAVGWVTFDLTSLPNRVYPLQMGVPNPLNLPALRPSAFIHVYGLHGDGSPATNIALGFDGGTGSVVGADGTTLAGWVVAWLPDGALAFPPDGKGQPTAISSPGAVVATGGYQNCGAASSGNLPGGQTQAVPNLQFVFATHNSACISFTKNTNYLQLSPAPTHQPRVTLQAETPDSSGVIAYFDTSQTAIFPALPAIGTNLPDGAFFPGTAPFSPVSIAVTLLPNAAGDRSPVLRTVGLRAFVNSDLSDVVEVEGVSWAVDPVTHKAEIPEIRLKGIHDGERDFRDVVTELLANNPIGNLYLSVWCGHPSIGGAYMKIDDFLIDKLIHEGPNARITGVGTLALLRGALPPFTPEVDAWPSADSAPSGGFNPGSWTTSANAGAGFFPYLADSNGINLIPWDDTTGWASPSSPSNQVVWTKLSGVGSPAQLAGVQIQVRMAVAALGQTLTLECDLYEGLTQRTSGSTGGGFGPQTPISVGAFSSGLGFLTYTYNLSPSQVSSIANWSNLYFKFTANGTGQILMTWARLAILGLRAPIIYSNAPLEGPSILSAATGPVADIVQAEAPVDARYRALLVPQASQGNSIQVSKLITAPVGGQTDIQIAKAEVDALGFIQGAFLHESQGKHKWTQFFNVVVDPSQNASYTPFLGPLAAIIPTEEVGEPLSISAGYEHRVPEWYCDFGWNFATSAAPGSGAAGSYFGEAYSASAPALLNLGDARIDQLARAPDRIAQWIPNLGIANGLAIRHTTVFGLGLLVWRFRSLYRRPELELGDVIAIQTDRFFAYDPLAAIPIKGLLWALGFVVGIYDIWGQDLAIWIPTYSQLVGGGSFGNPGQAALSFKRSYILNGNFAQQWANWTSFTTGDSMVSLGNGQFALSIGGAALQCVRNLNVQDTSPVFSPPYYAPITAPAGTTITGVMTALAGSGKTAQLTVLFYDRKLNFISQAVLCSTTSATFVTVTGSTTIPANAAYLVIQPDQTPTSGAVFAQFANVDVWS